MNALARWYREHFQKLGETADRAVPHEPDWDPDPAVPLRSRCERRAGRLGNLPHLDREVTGFCSACGAPVKR